MSSLLPQGSSNGGDEVGTDMGKGGGIPDDGASDLVGESMKGGGNGREWEVDAASALNRIIAAQQPNERMGLEGGAGDNTCEGSDSGSDGDGSEGSGGEGIWGSGEDHGRQVFDVE
ncbi:hypothetical protein Tco_0500970 [Tanacetum coccineum]